MLLAIDIGNTNIVIGGFNDDNLAFFARMSTNTTKTEDEYAAQLLDILSIHNVNKSLISGAIISSVVPQLNIIMKKAVSFAYGVDALLVGPGVKTGINIHCDNPTSVGADLICACVAAHHLYGSPSIVIDMGTATKMMYIDKTGAFTGASIIPGVNIALNALSRGTAQLPHISLEAPKSVLGKNTIECMRSGVVLGNACLIDGMIDRISDEIGEDLKIYATGGLSNSIIPHCKHDIVIDIDLVLKGLNIIYKKNR